MENNAALRSDLKSVAREVQNHVVPESYMLGYVQRRLKILSDQVAQEREEKKLALASENQRRYLRYQASLTRFTSIFQVLSRVNDEKESAQAVVATFNELKRLLLFLVDRENFPELNKLDLKQSLAIREAQDWLCQSFPNLGSKEVWSQFLPDFFYQSERAIFRLQTADVREGYHVACHVFAKVKMLLKSQSYCQEVLRLISSQSQNQQVNEALEAPVSHEDFPLKDILSMFGLLKETIEQAMELLKIYETSYYAISEKKHLEEKNQAYTCKMEINRKTQESMVYLHQLANFMLSKGVDQKTLQSSFQTVKDFYLVFYNQECPPVKDISLQLSIITDPLKPIQALNQAAGVWTRTGDIASNVFSSILGCEKENLSQADAQEIIEREKEWLSDYLIGSGEGSVGQQMSHLKRLHDTVIDSLRDYLSSGKFSGDHNRPIAVLSFICDGDPSQVGVGDNLNPFLRLYSQRLIYLLSKENGLMDLLQNHMESAYFFALSRDMAGQLRTDEPLQKALGQNIAARNYVYLVSTIEDYIEEWIFLWDFSNQVNKNLAINQMGLWIRNVFLDQSISQEIITKCINLSRDSVMLQSILIDLIHAEIIGFSSATGESVIQSDFYGACANHAIVNFLKSANINPSIISFKALPILIGWVHKYNIQLETPIIVWQKISLLCEAWGRDPSAFFDEYHSSEEDIKKLWIQYVQEHKDEIPYTLQHYQVLSRALNDAFPLPDQAIKNFLIFIEYKKNILIASRLVSYDTAASFQSEVIQLIPLKSAGELSIYEGFIFSFERCFVYLLKYKILCGNLSNQDLPSAIESLQNIFYLPANDFQHHIKQEAKSQGSPWFYLLENKLNSQVSCWKNDFSGSAHMRQFLVLRNNDPMFYKLCFSHLSGAKPLYQFFLVAIVWGFSDSAAVSCILQNLTCLMEALRDLSEEKKTDQDRVFMKWIEAFEHWRSFDFFGGEELNDMRVSSYAVNH